MDKLTIRPLDIFVIEAETRWSLLTQVIQLRTATLATHVVMARDTKGEIWDARAKSLDYNHLMEYQNREAWQLRWRYDLEFDDAAIWDKAEEIKQKARGYDFFSLAGFLLGVAAFNDEFRWYCAEHPFWSFQYTGHLLAPVGREPAFVYPSYFTQHVRLQLIAKGHLGTDLKV